MHIGNPPVVCGILDFQEDHHRVVRQGSVTVDDVFLSDQLVDGGVPSSKSELLRHDEILFVDVLHHALENNALKDSARCR